MANKVLECYARSMVDNIVVSKDEVWAYYRLKLVPTEFLSLNDRISLVQRLNNAFAAIVNNKTEDVNFQLLSVCLPVDLDQWEEVFDQVNSQWSTSPGYRNYLTKLRSYLERQGFLSRQVYLGIKLGERKAVDKSLSFKSGWKGISKFVSSLLALPSGDLTLQEEQTYRRMEATLWRTIQTGNLECVQPTARELLLLQKLMFYPALPIPDLLTEKERFGQGEITVDTSGQVTQKFSHLSFQQLVHGVKAEGYRATLTLSELPAEAEFPFTFPEFIYSAFRAGLPFTFFVCGQLKQTYSTKKEIDKQKKNLNDELQNLNKASNGGENVEQIGVVQEVSQTIGEFINLEQIIKNDKTPWVVAEYHIVVETPTEELLNKYVSATQQQYKDEGLTFWWSKGDQLDLFKRQMLAPKLSFKSRCHILTNLTALTGGGMNFGSEIGDIDLMRKPS